MYNGAALESGNQIEISLKTKLSPLKRLMFAQRLSHSLETVNIDAEKMQLGWHRKVPISCDVESQRWQVIIPKGPYACEYYSGLYVPALAGVISMVGVGREMLDCFQSMAQGIKNAAEAQRK